MKLQPRGRSRANPYIRPLTQTIYNELAGSREIGANLCIQGIEKGIIQVADESQFDAASDGEKCIQGIETGVKQVIQAFDDSQAWSDSQLLQLFTESAVSTQIGDGKSSTESDGNDSGKHGKCSDSQRAKKAQIEEDTQPAWNAGVGATSTTLFRRLKSGHFSFDIEPEPSPRAPDESVVEPDACAVASSHEVPNGSLVHDDNSEYDFYGRRIGRSPSPPLPPVKKYRWGEYIFKGRRDADGRGVKVVEWISGPGVGN